MWKWGLFYGLNFMPGNKLIHCCPAAVLAAGYFAENMI